MLSFKVDMQSEAMRVVNAMTRQDTYGSLAYAATRGVYGAIKRGYEAKWAGMKHRPIHNSL